MNGNKARLGARDMARAALLATLIAICTWISIPAPVPFTMQTFGVFSALALLGGRRGTQAVLVYLLMGAVGLPVFSGFQGGLGALAGPTGGYIAGFLACALIYWALTARLGASAWIMALGLSLGLIACYALGTIWFMISYARASGPIGLLTALGWCVFPFLLPDAGKLWLAVFLARRAGKALGQG